MPKLKAPPHGLSLQFVDANAREIDWGAAFGDGDGYEIQLPDPTYSDWGDRACDLPDDVARIAKRSPRRALEGEHLDAFRRSDAYGDWESGFDPMMNYAWPVSLAYGVQLADALAAMNEHAAACVLIQLSDEQNEALFGWGYDNPEYVIALTGGGMNLSDHLAAAYLACGCVPPYRILSGLAGVIDRDKAARLPLRAAYRRAAEHYTYRAKALRETSRRVHAA